MVADELVKKYGLYDPTLELPEYKLPDISILGNHYKNGYFLKDALLSDAFHQSTATLPIILGRNEKGKIIVGDLSKSKKILIAGNPSGTHRAILSVIESLLFKKHPAVLKFVMLDCDSTGNVLGIYNDIDHHFLAKLEEEEYAVKYVTDKSYLRTLTSLEKEMERRLLLFSKAKVCGINDYNLKFVQRELDVNEGHRYLPSFVLVINGLDYLYSLDKKRLTSILWRLSECSQKTGLCIVATVNSFNADLFQLMNDRTKIVCKSKFDKHIYKYLNVPWVDRLVDDCEIIYQDEYDTHILNSPDVDLMDARNTSCFIYDQQGYSEVFALPEPDVPTSESSDAVKGVDLTRDRDPFFNEVARTIVLNQDASVSMIQRKFSIGFNRAGRLMDQMEAAGIIGPARGSRKRDIYITTELELENLINNL